jgi:type I restriction enzyme S subunit
VEWLGKVPEHWGIVPLCSVFEREKSVGHETEELLSVYRDYGVIPKTSRDDNNNKASEDLSTYQLVEPGNLVTNKMKTWQGSIAISQFRGIVSPAYFVYRHKHEESAEHFHHLFRSLPYITGYMSASEGVRVNQWDLNPDLFRRFPVLLPSKGEQSLIAVYLDRETARIDALISKKTRFIELLREKRQALITQAVTKGLDPNVKMKDSGVEWLGEVPEHWEVKPIKWLSPVQRGASPRPIDDPKYFDDDGKHGWVRIEDVTSSGGYLKETKQKLSELGSSLSVKLPIGSLFLSIAGTVGKPCISLVDACIHDGFVYFPLLKISPEWLFRVFECKTPFVGLGKMGTQLNLNTETVGGIFVGLPPAEEIQNILEVMKERLTRIDTIIGRSERSIELLKERRSALITAAVTGQIDLREAA